MFKFTNGMLKLCGFQDCKKLVFGDLILLVGFRRPGRPPSTTGTITNYLTATTSSSSGNAAGAGFKRKTSIIYVDGDEDEEEGGSSQSGTWPS